jgi:hypothetical protein
MIPRGYAVKEFKKRFWKGCKPNFVCAPEEAERIICLSSQYPRRDFRREAGGFNVSYLALLPMGFSVPPRLLLERWALTPPFHPYRPLAQAAVCFLWHFPSNPDFPGLSRVYPRPNRGYVASRLAEFGLSSPSF